MLRDICTSMYFSDGGPQGERAARVILVRQPIKDPAFMAGFFVGWKSRGENLVRFDKIAGSDFE